MKRKLQDVAFTLLSILTIWGVMFGIDTFRASRQEKPVFCIEIYNAGNYQYRIGLFYGVYEHYDEFICTMDSCPIINVPHEYIVAPWFFSLN